MNAVRSQEQVDADLERDIDAAYDRMIAAPNDTESKAHFQEMTRLIYRRSPHRIQQMELERRLKFKRAKQT